MPTRIFKFGMPAVAPSTPKPEIDALLLTLMWEKQSPASELFAAEHIFGMAMEVFIKDASYWGGRWEKNPAFSPKKLAAAKDIAAESRARLQEQGLVAPSMHRPHSGPPRTLYELTAAGRARVLDLFADAANEERIVKEQAKAMRARKVAKKPALKKRTPRKAVGTGDGVYDPETRKPLKPAKKKVVKRG